MKRSIALFLTAATLFSAEGTVYADDAYQGIFKKGDVYLDLPLYTSADPAYDLEDYKRLGVCYSVSEPERDEYNYVRAETKETLGEIYVDKATGTKYVIIGDSGSYELNYGDGSIAVTARDGSDEQFTGSYVQVSNAGADMMPSEIWLKIPAEEAPAESGIAIVMNGSSLEFPQAPYIVNSTTMVPMRAIFEALGAEIEWNAEEKSVTAVRNGVEVKLAIGNGTAYISGKAAELAVSPEIKNGSTMIPLRFVSEALGAEVGWNAETKTVIIDDAATAEIWADGRDYRERYEEIKEMLADEDTYSVMAQIDLNRYMGGLSEKSARLLDDLYAFLSDILPSDEYAEIEIGMEQWENEVDSGLKALAEEWGGGTGLSAVSSAFETEKALEKIEELLVYVE